MRDKDDLHVVILRAQETHHPEEERARDILLKLAHRTRHVHQSEHHRVRLVAVILFPTFETHVLFLDVAELRALRLARVAFDVLQDKPTLIEIRHHARASNFVEARRLRRDGLLRLLFEEGQLEVFEDERGEFVYVDFGFVVVSARVLSGGAGAAALSLSLSLRLLARQHVAHARLAVALSHVFALAIIEAKLVLVERTNGNFHAALAVGQNDRFVGDDGAEVFADRIFDALLVPLLINDALALQRPIVALYRHDLKTPLTRPAQAATVQRPFCRPGKTPRRARRIPAGVPPAASGRSWERRRGATLRSIRAGVRPN